jgi:hypothetical protein
VVELVDTLALGASAARREGSSPFIPTKNETLSQEAGLFVFHAVSLESGTKREGSRSESTRTSLLGACLSEEAQRYSFHPFLR